MSNKKELTQPEIDKLNTEEETLITTIQKSEGLENMSLYKIRKLVAMIYKKQGYQDK